MSVAFVPFAGQPVRSRTCSLFEFTESVYEAGFRIPEHAHAEPYIGITISGEWGQEYENHSRHGGPWTVTFHPAGEIHSNRFFDNPVRILNISIISGRFCQMLGAGLSLKHSASLNEGKATWIAREIYRELCWPDAVSALVLNGLTLQLLAELLVSCCRPPGEVAPAWLCRAKKVVETRFAEPFHLQAIASAVGVHPVHLARAFHRHFHVTVGQKIRDMRISQASQFLTESNLPLVQIALEVGFSDQASFSTVFRKRTGLTPSEFRRLNRRR
ncbi:MAG TPA: AraC family transcriptional regulator [Candidatus Acidoferrales bacterium]|nr:AraC family transcriptional regulator [Candidatus Acidoferrales bacterium]